MSCLNKFYYFVTDTIRAVRLGLTIELQELKKKNQIVRIILFVYDI